MSIVPARHRRLVLPPAAAALLLALAAAPCPGPARAAEAPEAAASDGASGSGAVSAAERQIFLAPHLQGLKPDTVLRYAFVHGGSLEPGYDGPLELKLRAGADGRCCDASATFPEAQGPRAVPEVEHASANPVILYFLEHELREMQRFTRGQMNHFRRRIRLALAAGPAGEAVRVRWQGKELPAQRIGVSPYLDDPARNRYENFAAMRYDFVLADGVPGGVVQLRSTLPGPAPDAAPRLEDTLTLEGAEVIGASKP